MPKNLLSKLSLAQYFQLADSVLPTGGFAFSNGLESLAKLGFLRDLNAFKRYLDCTIRQAVTFDIPFLNSFFSLDRSEWDACLEPLVREWDSFFTASTQHRASILQGNAWMRWLDAVYPEKGATEFRTWSEKKELPLHHLPVFVLGLSALGAGWKDCQSLFLHIALRDQVSASVRLGLIGPMQAQGLQKTYSALGEELIGCDGILFHDEAYRSSPLLDIAQARHSHLYSRLFQS